MHYIANILIAVEGDGAQVELYGIGYHLLRDDPGVLEGVLGESKYLELSPRLGQRFEMWVGVRYAVEMQRRGDEWRIMTMQPIIEWSRVQEYAGITEGGLLAAMPSKAAQDRSDPSYFEGAFAP